MKFKRITLLCGHYGSGKTNVAVNMALKLKEQYENVAIADLDIVNPYFRSKDSEQDFKNAGIRLICSPYANSNVDIPALPQEMYAIVDDLSLRTIIDVGGDDRGALALGRLSQKIIEENNYEMYMVINCFRPLTRDVNSTLEVMQEIETACKMKITALINNSNLGEITTSQDVLDSVKYAKEVEKASGVKLKFTTVRQELYSELVGKIDTLIPLNLQKKLIK